ncbi:MAG: hypothetical protein B6229_00245 [Spirochaetaceae bacterium 4572_7]|nr:MAG: hypothetical protein B6229_00245 [Spirochaetaceae bacterium 4572_7]
MTITIDKKQIDFTLENESKLLTVIDNIKTWLGESQLIIEKLYVNNSDYSNGDLNIDLNDVNRIDIETLSFLDLNINNLTWILYFFERLQSAVDVWDTKLLSEVKDEAPFILSHLPTILSLDNTVPEDIYSENLLELFKVYNYFQCKESIVDKKNVSKQLADIITLISERLREFNNPKEELLGSIKVLVLLKDDIESVSLYLQSGKTDKAALIMTKLINLLQKVLRILNFNIKDSNITGGKDIIEFTNGLNDILIELIEGYESQDIVLIGDILEYELSPRIDDLSNFFN